MQNRAGEDKDLEEHRFDANNVHSRLNLTMDNVANEIEVDLEMDGDQPSKFFGYFKNNSHLKFK